MLVFCYLCLNSTQWQKPGFPKVKLPHPNKGVKPSSATGAGLSHTQPYRGEWAGAWDGLLLSDRRCLVVLLCCEIFIRSISEVVWQGDLWFQPADGCP